MKPHGLFLLFLGLVSALFFSATFIVNKIISVEGGHWFFSGSLRYLYTLIFLALILIVFKGWAYFQAVLCEYKHHFIFWNMAGIIGFGIFYSMICFAADYSPAWVLVTTWQLTIFGSLFVLLLFGKKLSKITLFCATLVVLGITMVNVSHFELSNMKELFYSALPVIVAAFAFPLGNQLVWEQKKKREIPILDNAFSKVFLLTLGSSPLWIVLFLFVDASTPSVSQWLNVALISVLSGVIATSIFLYARSQANTAGKIMIVDGTISGEVIFTLLCEILFLNAVLPTFMGMIGICITVMALFMMVYFDKTEA